MGRKRKTVPRERNGRPQRESREDITSVVGRRRCWEMGLRPTTENLKLAVSEVGGTYWGKLYHANKITLRQREAFKAFAILEEAYRQSIDAPKPTPKGATLNGGGGKSTAEENIGRTVATRARYEAIDWALHRSPGNVRRAVFNVIAEVPVSDEDAKAAGVAIEILMLDGR